jgi:mannose-6-phosphate isomerase-like protein (cupin superfamily)
MTDDNLRGGVVFRAKELAGSEYLPNKGVFLAGMLTRARGDGFGLYFGRMSPGAEISREIHPQTTETVYIVSGKATGVVGEREVPLEAGDVLHVDKNVHHGLKNRGDGVLEFLVIGHPDF